ncbi:hypothetical protein Tcan_10831 [Toxocara canis]|uniref:Uncharacterized protein n=1 Tax=Toxocara canis TaxID=6265 RepID=A0A0B2UX22_TOXCA|nr:hypothetical protein Tcan_10831 [Toxocara canis]
MQKYIPIWMKAYKKRLATEMERLRRKKTINALNLLNATWPNRGTKVLLEMEQCTLAILYKAYTCSEQRKCITNLQNIRNDEWIYAKRMWVPLHDSSIF